MFNAKHQIKSLLTYAGLTLADVARRARVSPAHARKVLLRYGGSPAHVVRGEKTRRVIKEFIRHTEPGYWPALPKAPARRAAAENRCHPPPS